MNIPNIIMVYLCRNTHTSQRQGQYSYKIYISILAVALAASSGGSTSSRGSPYNLTVSAVSSKAATVQWELTSQYLSPIHSPGGNYSGTGGSSMEEPKLIKSFQMILKPTFPPLGGSGDDSDSDNSKSGGTKPLSHSSSGNFLINVTLDGTKRFYTFKGLQSRTEYQVYIVAKGEDGSGNVSETVIFTTIEEDKESVNLRRNPNPAEIVLVILILLAWFCAIALFLHKWGKIRIIQPREPRFKHSPKNLDTIKVVKKPTDSVIHKHYTRQVSRNMVARENRRIERMNTMPNIKVNTEAIRAHEQLEKKFQPLPVIEMETLSPTKESPAEESQTQ